LKKPQLILGLSSLVLLCSLYFLAPRFKKSTISTTVNSGQQLAITNASILENAKLSLSAEHKITLLSLDNELVKSKTMADSLHVYHEMADFWGKTVGKPEPYFYYTYSAALLENSEKSLTFAAQLLVDNLTSPEAPPDMQPWIAGNAKVLLEKALVLNPKNDSAIVNLGACYLFGNLSDNPMAGIQKIKEVLDKNPQNTYGQLMLGLGGKKSGQYDKAIERFTLVLKDDSNNLEAMVNLAECYELTDKKQLAIEWYTKVNDRVTVPQAKEAITKRIKLLKK
jgi:tetratricopeptide (TPR) repeat protein